MRQHVALVALTAAAAASIATSPIDGDAIFSGADNVQGPPLLVGADHPRWDFEILTELELPLEAERSGFTSALSVDFQLVDPPLDPQLDAWLSDCSSEERLAEVANGQIRLEDPYADCAPDEACEVRTCLHLASENEAPIPLIFTVEGHLTSEEWAEDVEGDTIPFEITLTLLDDEEEL